MSCVNLRRVPRYVSVCFSWKRRRVAQAVIVEAFLLRGNPSLPSPGYVSVGPLGSLMPHDDWRKLTPNPTHVGLG